MRHINDERYCVDITRSYLWDGEHHTIAYPPQFTFAQTPHEARENVRARLNHDNNYQLTSYLYTPQTALKGDETSEEVRLR